MKKQNRKPQSARERRKLNLAKYYRDNLENRNLAEDIADMLKQPPHELPEDYVDDEDGTIDPDAIFDED